MDEIASKLRKLSREQLLVFGYLCCTYLFDSYRAFSLKYDQGDIKLLKRAIAVIRDRIVLKSPVPNLNKTLSLVEKEIPHTEDYPSVLSSFALDASNAIFETLSFLKNDDVQRIIDISIFCRDTVDMYIQERDDMDYDDPRFEDRIAKDKLMIAELDRQRKLIDKIRSTDEFDSDAISQLQAINQITNRPDLSIFL